MALRTGELIPELFKRHPKWNALSADDLLKLKEILIMITDDIMDVCERNNITCLASYGSVLGAVRHKGYIPWDDDIDLYLSRQDYEKFLQIWEKEMGNKYYVRSVANGNPIGTPNCHVHLKGTRYVNYGDMVMTQNEPEETKGIYVDIHILDDAPDNGILRYIHGAKCLSLLFICSCVHVKDTVDLLVRDGVEITKDEYKQLRGKLRLGRLLSFKSKAEWARIYDKATSSVRNPKSKYISCYYGYKSFKKSVMPRVDVFPVVKGKFESRNWNIPGNYDAYLTRIYGDYMTPPDGNHERIHPVFELDFGQY